MGVKFRLNGLSYKRLDIIMSTKSIFLNFDPKVDDNNASNPPHLLWVRALT
jgi:hypothetical protein